MGSPRQAVNRRRRTREGPEPASVQTPDHIGRGTRRGAELETVTTSRSPTTVVTANGEVQTHEEATVYVKELDIFLTMKVLEDRPAVLSLGELCDEQRIFLRMDQR